MALDCKSRGAENTINLWYSILRIVALEIPFTAKAIVTSATYHDEIFCYWSSISINCHTTTSAPIIMNSRFYVTCLPKSALIATQAYINISLNYVLNLTSQTIEHVHLRQKNRSSWVTITSDDKWGAATPVRAILELLCDASYYFNCITQ